MVVPGGSSLSVLQSELVITDGFRLLIIPGGGRPLEMQAELWPGNWSAEGSEPSLTLLDLPKGAGRQEIGVGGLTAWLLVATGIWDYGSRCEMEDGTQRGQGKPQGHWACPGPNWQGFGTGADVSFNLIIFCRFYFPAFLHAPKSLWILFCWIVNIFTFCKSFWFCF